MKNNSPLLLPYNCHLLAPDQIWTSKERKTRAGIILLPIANNSLKLKKHHVKEVSKCLAAIGTHFTLGNNESVSHQSRKIYAENKRWVFYFLNPVQKCQINYTWTRYMRSQMMATKNQFHVCTSTSCINVQIRRRWMIYIPDRYYIQISHQVLQFGLQGESRYHKIMVIKHDPITGLSGVP
jgi:hypothetical protein